MKTKISWSSFTAGGMIIALLVLFVLVGTDPGDSWETTSEIMTNSDGKRELIGTIQNKSDEVVHHVHTTVHFYDKDNRVVDVRFIEVGRIPAGKSAGIRIDIDDDRITHHCMGLPEGHRNE